MDKPNLNGLSDTEALDVIAHLVDLAADTNNLVLIEHVLALASQLDARGLLPQEAALLDYFRANAWACRYQRRYQERSGLWNFEQPEVQQQVFLLRRAVHSLGFASLDVIRRCQILTNLGNQFDALGRFIDAHACWVSALAIDPRFWMARANRGRGLMFYAAALYDRGHESVFAFHAYKDLTEAEELIDKLPHLGDPGLRRRFEADARQIAGHYNLEAIGKTYQSNDWPLCDEPTEQAYRTWCLKHTLFVNPLNDVNPATIAANDVLGLPTITLGIGEPPVIAGMFNELKQLFASARWLLWEGLAREEPHFSDRGVLLAETLDYASYGLTVEKIKVAFRMAYSVFDKIAYFLNFYLALGVSERRVSFRTIWREKEDGPIRDVIAKSENWPLRGLYWLSKDLFEKGMSDSMEPEARALAELRNHLEHKYVKVHEMSIPIRGEGDPFHDTLAYSVPRSDLEGRTLRLMQLARSALVYLSLAVHHEERRRDKGRTGSHGSIKLGSVRDEWKR